MSCKNACTCGRLCPNFVITTGVAFAGGNLILTLPDDITYSNGCQYCFVIGQTIPNTTTINTVAVAVIGDGTTEFPIVNRCGTPVLAYQLDVRTRYTFRVSTTATGGVIKLLGNLPSVANTTLNALNDAEGGAGA